jgi:hypothetical protein
VIIIKSPATVFGPKSPLAESRTPGCDGLIQSKVHIEFEKGRAAPRAAIEILMQNNCAKAAINFVCLADKDE